MADGWEVRPTAVQHTWRGVLHAAKTFMSDELIATLAGIVGRLRTLAEQDAEFRGLIHSLAQAVLAATAEPASIPDLATDAAADRAAGVLDHPPGSLLAGEPPLPPLPPVATIPLPLPSSGQPDSASGSDPAFSPRGG